MAYSAANPGKSTGIEVDPPAFAFAITPTNDTQFAHSTRAIFVGVGGNVVVCPVGQTTTVTLLNVPSGTLLPIQAQGVNSTSTTATNLVGFY